MIYVIGAIGVAFLLMFGAMRVQHGELVQAKANVTQAEAKTTEAIAANRALESSVGQYKAVCEQARTTVTAIGKNDAARAAATAKFLASLDASSADSRAKIDALTKAAKTPTPGDDNAKCKQAAATLRDLATDRLRDTAP